MIAAPILQIRWLLFLALGCTAFAADVDESKIPPAAGIKVDFTRDIKPILETSCFRCHGPEKPRSRFRLDNRESALKGGDNGVDIIPANSAKSPLIHYVSRLVTDMEMPPPGKGEPLTKLQIALFRAWIDQGVAWEKSEPTPPLTFTISPVLGWTGVNGDAHKFEERYWEHAGPNGGIEQFELRDTLSPDSKLTTYGHLLRDDYKLQLDYQKNDIGFVHSGWEQYRKYYDGTGGFYPLFSPSAFSLGQDLHLDVGRAWIDFGLTLPDLPQMVFGYEYQYRKGNEANLEWGGVEQNNVARDIAPSSNGLNERTHIIKFDLEDEIGGARIEENFRAEFYDLQTQSTNNNFDPDISAFFTDNQSQAYHQFQAANVLRAEKQFTDWFYGSAGYLYSKLSADASFTINTTDINTTVLPEDRWHSQQITLERDSHVFNVNGLLTPCDGLTLSGGVQAEWTRQNGFGSVSLDEFFPSPLNLLVPVPVLMQSDFDTSLVEETIALRYAKIPFTSLFAEGRFQQERIGEFQEQMNGQPDFLLDTEFTSQMYDMRVGFNTSPWTWGSFSAHYRRYDDDSHYNNTQDLEFGFPAAGQGDYPGFILSRDLATDEVEAKLVLRPARWLKATLSYQWQSTDYRTVTDLITFSTPGDGSPGGGLLAGRTRSHTYSFNTAFTPCQRLYLAATFSYQDSSTFTADNGSTAVAPYQGSTYTAFANATYVLNKDTDLFVAGSYAYSDYAQNNFAGGLPLGLQYQQQMIQAGLTRHITKNITTKLQYSLFHYNEPTSGGLANYTANAIFGMVTFRLP